MLKGVPITNIFIPKEEYIITDPDSNSKSIYKHPKYYQNFTLLAMSLT